MNTKIELTYKDVNYTLEFTRASVKVLEANGFKVDEFLEKPLTNIDLVFQGAFIKNHSKTPVSVINEILEMCPDKNGLILTLKRMIDETYESLLAEPDKDHEGNVTWKTLDLSPKKTNQE